MQITILKAAIIAIILNIILPYFVSPFATEREKNACIKDTDLNFKEKFVIMLLHHQYMPIMSSVIVAIVIFVSVNIALLISK